MARMRQHLNIIVRRPVEEVFSAFVWSLAKGQDGGDVYPPPPYEESGLAVGVKVHDSRMDQRGYQIDSVYEITELNAPTKIAFDAQSVFANPQPSKTLTPSQISAVTQTSRAYSFAPEGANTRMTIENTFEFSLPLVYYLLLPLRSSRRAEMMYKQAYAWRDALERRAGLVPRKYNLRLRQSWVFWSAYVALVALMFWVYLARASLSLDPGVVGLLQLVLTVLITAGLVLFLVVNFYFRER